MAVLKCSRNWERRTVYFIFLGLQNISIVSASQKVIFLSFTFIFSQKYSVASGPKIPRGRESLFPKICLADVIVPLGLRLTLITLGKSPSYPLTWRKLIFIFCCCCSVAKSCPTLQLGHQAPLSFTVSWSLLGFMSIELLMLSNRLIFCHSFSYCIQSFPASGSFPMSQKVVELCIRWWSFNFSINSSNEYSGLISFRIDLFDLLSVQGILKNPLQHHNSKASVLGTQPSVGSNSPILTWC